MYNVHIDSLMGVDEMLNIRGCLDKYRIDPESPTGAVQDIRSIVDGIKPHMQLDYIQEMSKDIFGIPVPAVGGIAARIILQYAVNSAVARACDVPEPEQLMQEAVSKANQFIHKRGNHVFWAEAPAGALQITPETVDVVRPAVVQKSADEIRQEVREGGKPKRGDKKILIEQLFRDLVLTASSPMSRKQFLATIMADERIQMTKSGGNTYMYNMKQQFSGELAAAGIDW